MCCMELGVLEQPSTPRGFIFAQMVGALWCCIPPSGTLFKLFQNRRWLKPHGTNQCCFFPFYRAENLGLLGLLALFFYLITCQTMFRRTAL